jgi:hypothetical protein
MTPINLDDFITQLSKTTKIPAKGWNKNNHGEALLECSGFTVEISAGEKMINGEYSVYPRIKLTEAKMYKLSKKRDELEKTNKEKELQKKRIFKP